MQVLGGVDGFGFLLGISLGGLAGAGAATLVAGKGLSYLSDDPKACANCHIMREAYDAWQNSSHHAQATCNDCHLPRAMIPKIVAKAENGWRHSLAFTLQDFHEPIRIRSRNRVILEARCAECHRDRVEGILHEAPDCVRCHRDAGHGAWR